MNNGEKIDLKIQFLTRQLKAIQKIINDGTHVGTITRENKMIRISEVINQEALSQVNDLLKLTRSILEECDKDPDLNNLAIKYLLNQNVLLEKLKETLIPKSSFF